MPLCIFWLHITISSIAYHRLTMYFVNNPGTRHPVSLHHLLEGYKCNICYNTKKRKKGTRYMVWCITLHTYTHILGTLSQKFYTDHEYKIFYFILLFN